MLTTSLTMSAQTAPQAVFTGKYPTTKKVEQSDEYFGTKVSDPYRWLENDRAPETEQWVEEQNKVTFSYLEKIPFREQLKKRLTEIWNYPKYSSPSKKAGMYFFSKNDGLQNQSVLYMQTSLSAEPQVLLDPNKLSNDGTAALASTSISKDGKYLGYGVQRSGSDWTEFYVMEIATRKVLADHIEWAKFSGISWRGDGFFYSRYDAPKDKNKAYSVKNEYHKVYYHKVGTPQSTDVLVYEDKDHAQRNHSVYLDDNEEYAFLNISEGTSGNALWFKKANDMNAKFSPLVAGFQDDISVIEVVNGKFYCFTNIGAPNNRVVLIDPNNPDRSAWKEIIPEAKENLQSATIAGGKIFLNYLKDASTKIYIHNLDGSRDGEVALPGICSAGGFGGEMNETELFYTVSSYTLPPTIYRFDVKTKTSTIFRKTEVKLNTDDYVTEQHFFTSKDGARVPMFIIHKKGIALNGKNPTLLYGYGGFQISMTPGFSITNMAWLEQGGIYVVVNLRGGTEYGEAWHEAGTKLKKQNVFNDFIGAAEYLIAKQYTSSAYLAINGGSNGGLLVGAVMTQRPDLMRVAIPEVGVLDMLRYHRFTIGWAWAGDYGRSDDNKEMFEYLYKYSPIHALKNGTAYPATMVMTADHDDRVVPAHSFKFAATLQAAHTGTNPVLIRIDAKAGHGAGKPTAKVIEAKADFFAFIWWNMGFTPKW